ncbi:hypothetical protein Syun_002577 [Stephania yunnanensis]|uniref:Pentatricopeptide repeat-containing protein n=1 Tax=Stephania yunnanensis TaxID=152371 RepID=A0AAP0Q7A7_9MAGN
MILRPVWKLKETQIHNPLKPICALNYSLYTKQCTTSHAHKLFEEMPQRDPYQLNNKPISEYTRNGFNNEALHLFVEIHGSGMPIEGPDLSSVLKACACLGDQVFGRGVHSLCVKKREEVDVGVGTSLVDMYMKSGWVDEGKKVFDEMPDRNVVSWTSLLVGYTQNGMVEESLEVFCGMQVEGIKPNPYTFAGVLAALAAADGAAEKGNQAHGQIIKLGFESTTFVVNSLISMYAKSGLVGESMLVFESMDNKDAVTWNGMIAGLVLNGFDVEALRLFRRMRLAGVKLSRPIFATAIKLCINLRELGLARQLHCRVLKIGFEYDHSIRTAFVVAYSKCGEMDDAFGMFSSMDGLQNVVSWTAMISGQMQNGSIEQALHLFRRMSREGH